MADIFDVAGKITLDSSEYRSGMDDAISKASSFAERLTDLQTTYNQTTAEAKVLQKALAEYVQETGNAEGAGRDLAAMLAEKQLAAQEAKAAIQQLNESEQQSSNTAQKLGDDSAQAGRDIEDVGEKARKTGDDLDNASGKASNFGAILAGAAKASTAAVAAVGTAAVAAVGSLGKLVKSTADYGDNVDKMSQKMGLSASAYQEWDFVLQHAGTSISSLKMGMRTLATAAENGNDAFQKLGITQSELNNLSQEQLFSRTISALQNVTDETERTYLTGQLLGRGATELGALLNMSAEETEAMKQQVHELGGVMSDDAVKASARFADNMQDLRTKISGFGRNIAAEFLPGVNDVIEGLTLLLSSSDQAGDKITSGLSAITDRVQSILPKISSTFSTIGNAFIGIAPDVVRVGVDLLEGLTSSLIDNAPQLSRAIISIGQTLVSGIGTLAPMLLDGAFSIVSELANGIAQALPALIPAAVDIVSKLAITLTSPENIMLLINGAIALMQGLTEGLLKGRAVLFNAVPSIIENLVNAIIQAAPQLLIGATEIMVQLTTGLIQEVPVLLEKIPEIVAIILQGFIDQFPAFLKAGAGIASSLWNGIKGLFSGKKSEDLTTNVNFDSVGKKAQITAETVTRTLSTIGSTPIDLSTATGTANAQLQEFSNAADDTSKTVSATFTTMGTEISDAMTQAANSGTTDWSATIKAAGAAAQDIVNQFKGVPSKFDEIWKKVQDVFTPVPTFFQGVFSDAARNAVAAWTYVPAEFGAIWQLIKNQFRVSQAYSWGADMMSNFISGVRAKRPALIAELTSIAQTVKDTLGHTTPKTGPLKGDDMWTVHMMDNFTRGIISRKDEFQDALSMTFTAPRYMSAGPASSGLEAKVDRLVSVVEQYIPEIAQQQVVLDSGAIVGEILPAVDNGLGRRYSYAERGNA